ncbi:MAG TPA: BON domain-containing protein [Methylotenera sp.]|nr:BON domain-containing protein [Methylotenera sp.]
MKQLKNIPTLILAGVLAASVGCTSNTKKDDRAPETKKESVGEYFDDTVITTKVKAAILNESTLKSSEIQVETYKGVVQLSGFVNSQADIDKAVEVARGVKGVTSVKNDMRLKVN